MIKKYLEFMKEENKFNSLGEWVESLIDDEYIKNIVFRYTKDIDPSVNLSNAINVLDKDIQDEIKQQINNYLENGIEEKDPTTIASVDVEPLMESDISISGKGVFTSFLKVITALGFKENLPNWERCPDDFLIYYHFKDVDSEAVKQLFSRFKSLIRYIDMIDYQKNELDVYFGIKLNGQFEYGFSYDYSNSPIGQFGLSSGIIKWICQLESKSAASLKKILVNLSYQDIITFGQIKSDMLSFRPGYYEKKNYPIIEDRVISFGYFGIGRWDNGKLDEGEFQNIKSNFNTWLLSRRWGGKVLINVKALSFWTYFNIKIK